MKKILFGNLFANRKSRVSVETDYLNNSISIYDLEHRQKDIEIGMFR